MASTGGGFLERMGARAHRRAEPRMWVALAAVGCAMAVVGIYLISGDAQAGDADGNGSALTGIVLSLAVVVVGYVLMHVLQEAPAASAGVTAVILGLPGLAFFLTIDVDDLPPFSIEAVLGLPALVWGLSYLIGPGRGRPVLLGFALVFAWLFVLQVVDDPLDDGALGGVVVGGGVFGDTPVDGGFDDDFGDGGFDDGGGFGDDSLDDSFASDGGPDTSTIGWLSVLFGAGYLALARVLDRRGNEGVGTPFIVGGHVALILGLNFLAEDLQAAGVGVAFVIAGVLVAWLGAVSGRRLTTIIGALEVGLGATVVLGDAMDDASAAGFGAALFVLGAVVLALAQVLHTATGEPPQTTPGRSSFPRWSQARRVQVTAGAAPGGFAAGGPWSDPSAPSPWAPPTAGPPGAFPGAPTPTPSGPPLHPGQAPPVAAGQVAPPVAAGQAAPPAGSPWAPPAPDPVPPGRPASDLPAPGPSTPDAPPAHDATPADGDATPPGASYPPPPPPPPPPPDPES